MGVQTGPHGGEHAPVLLHWACLLCLPAVSIFIPRRDAGNRHDCRRLRKWKVNPSQALGEPASGSLWNTIPYYSMEAQNGCHFTKLTVYSQGVRWEWILVHFSLITHSLSVLLWVTCWKASQARLDTLRSYSGIKIVNSCPLPPPRKSFMVKLMRCRAAGQWLGCVIDGV